MHNAQAKEESGILRSSIDSVNSNLAESVSTLSEQEQKLDNLQQTVAELKDDFTGFKDNVEQQVTIVVMNVGVTFHKVEEPSSLVGGC